MRGARSPGWRRRKTNGGSTNTTRSADASASAARNRDKPGTDFHWHGDQLTEEIPVSADGTPDHDNVIRWIYEPGSFTPLARYEKGELHYAVTDITGRIQELATEDGTLVWRGQQQLWGREESRNKEDAPSCRLRFPGQYEDAESGLYYNRFRYYDCGTGQYISADPIGLAGGVSPYNYVNNPLKYIDFLVLRLSKGAYRDTGGHHIYSKAGFKNTPNYNPRDAFSISYDYIESMGWNHSDMTTHQRRAFKGLYENGKCNTLKEHTKIAVDALMASGATKQEARDLVAEALRDLRKNKTVTPPNIPWYA